MNYVGFFIEFVVPPLIVLWGVCAIITRATDIFSERDKE